MASFRVADISSNYNIWLPGIVSQPIFLFVKSKYRIYFSRNSNNSDINDAAEEAKALLIYDLANPNHLVHCPT